MPTGFRRRRRTVAISPRLSRGGAMRALSALLAAKRREIYTFRHGACVLPVRVAKREIANLGIWGMFDTAAARRMMVDGQVRTADVTNLNLIDAMLAVPRELFVPPAVAGQAYLDSDIAVAKGRALLKPMVLAKLIQAAQVVGTDHVLDVGCATGYSSAVLARLAGSV